VVDAFFGPYKNTQALYYVSREKVALNVRRIYFTASTNNVPKADITGLKALYLIDETVKFIGDQSSDKDGDALTFLWEFGDGRTSTAINPSIKYSSRGSYNVRLTVTDTKNQTDQDTAVVLIGSRPYAKMESPQKNFEFKVGDVFRLRGSGFDFALNQSIVNPLQYFWEVRQYHENHYHPFLDFKPGNNFDLFPAPAPEVFYAATNSYLKNIYDGLRFRRCFPSCLQNNISKEDNTQCCELPQWTECIVGKRCYYDTYQCNRMAKSGHYNRCTGSK
jgi:hypothetical protein